MSEHDPPAERPASPTGGERRRLEHAPAERYRDGGAAAGPGAATGPGSATRPGATTRRSVFLAVVVADIGAILFFALGLLDLGPGLLAVAAFIGWATALALVWGGRVTGIATQRTRVAAAAFLGGWAIVAGIVVDWVYALAQGGVLGPLDYIAQRYGPVAWLSILVAAAVAALRAR